MGAPAKVGSGADGEAGERAVAAAVADVAVVEVWVLHVVGVGAGFVARAGFVPDAFGADAGAADPAAGDVVAVGGAAGVGGGVHEVGGGVVGDVDVVVVVVVVFAALVGLQDGLAARAGGHDVVVFDVVVAGGVGDVDGAGVGIGEDVVAHGVVVAAVLERDVAGVVMEVVAADFAVADGGEGDAVVGAAHLVAAHGDVFDGAAGVGFGDSAVFDVLPPDGRFGVAPLGVAGFTPSGDFAGFAPSGDFAGFAPSGDFAGFVPSGGFAGFAPSGDFAGFAPSEMKPDLAKREKYRACGKGRAPSGVNTGPAKRRLCRIRAKR